jgi:hypothetical protein
MGGVVIVCGRSIGRTRRPCILQRFAVLGIGHEQFRCWRPRLKLFFQEVADR